MVRRDAVSCEQMFEVGIKKHHMQVCKHRRNARRRGRPAAERKHAAPAWEHPSEQVPLRQLEPLASEIHNELASTDTVRLLHVVVEVVEVDTQTPCHHRANRALAYAGRPDENE